MCGGCNVLAEGAGVSVIMARYWWVARQGRKAVAEAERIAAREPVPVPVPVADFVDPMADVTRIV
jgi:hypothetical protein